MDQKGTLICYNLQGQFHQHFMRSFYACRPQKRNKAWQFEQLFALSGSADVKAVRKNIDEIDSRQS